MSDEFRTALGRAEERINERQDRLIDRVEEGISKIFAKVDQRMDSSDTTARIEREEIKRAIGDLRDGAAIQGRLIDSQGRQIAELERMTSTGMKSSAEGAAKGAGEAAGAVATAAAAVLAERNRPFMKTRIGKVVVFCSAFSAVVLAIGQIPNVLRVVSVVWTFIEGMAK